MKQLLFKHHRFHGSRTALALLFSAILALSLLGISSPAWGDNSRESVTNTGNAVFSGSDYVASKQVFARQDDGENTLFIGETTNGPDALQTLENDSMAVNPSFTGSAFGWEIPFDADFIEVASVFGKATGSSSQSLSTLSPRSNGASTLGNAAADPYSSLDGTSDDASSDEVGETGTSSADSNQDQQSDSNQGLFYKDPIGSFMGVKNITTLMVYDSSYDVSKAGVYDPKFEASFGGGFVDGWYDSTGMPIGSGSWEAGDIYYLSRQTVQGILPADYLAQNPSVLSNGVLTFYGLDEMVLNDRVANDLSVTGVTTAFTPGDFKFWTEEITGKNQNQNLYWYIPMASLPTEGAPLRLVYTVGIADAYLNASGSVDFNAVASAPTGADYLADHVSDTGTVSFDTNYTTGTSPLFSNSANGNLFSQLPSTTQPGQSSSLQTIDGGLGQNGHMTVEPTGLLVKSQMIISPIAVEDAGSEAAAISAATQNSAFSYKVKLENEDGTPVTGMNYAWPYTLDEGSDQWVPDLASAGLKTVSFNDSGEARFSLDSDQGLFFAGLASNTNYSVTGTLNANQTEHGVEISTITGPAGATDVNLDAVEGTVSGTTDDAQNEISYENTYYGPDYELSTTALMNPSSGSSGSSSSSSGSHSSSSGSSSANAPDLRVTKTQSVNGSSASSSYQVVHSGDTLTYNITVTNQGGSAANGVVLVDQVPKGFTVMSSTVTDGGTIGAGNSAVQWNVGTLSPGASETVSFSAVTPTVDAPSSWVNRAYATFSNNPLGASERIVSNAVQTGTQVSSAGATNSNNNSSGSTGNTVSPGSTTTPTPSNPSTPNTITPTPDSGTVNPGTTTTPGSGASSTPGKVPQTGDDLSVIPFVISSLLAVGAMVVAIRALFDYRKLASRKH